MSKLAININSISFSYGKQEIIKDCTAKIEKGTVTALLGANGQGKTTLIKCLLNHLKISKGSIEILGKDISKYSVLELAKKVSYVPQASTIASDTTVRDYIVEGRTPYLSTFSMPGVEDYELGEKYAKLLGIIDLLGKNVNHLSGGQLQSVLIVRSLVQDTDIIILDEPTAALDMSMQVEFLKVVEQLEEMGKTILFTTHNPEHALVLNCNTWIMSEQHITYVGNANEILSNEVLQELYGSGVCLIQHSDRKICTFT